MALLRAAAANTTRQVQLSIIKSLLKVAGRINPIFLSDFLKEANKVLGPSLDVANYAALRIESLKVLILVLKKKPSFRVEEFLRDVSPEVKSRAEEAKRLKNE